MSYEEAVEIMNEYFEKNSELEEKQEMDHIEKEAQKIIIEKHTK